ncbi:SET and MYND domain-containing protein 4 [Cephus cinctus]|uniref:SET and MYND domain-containing protein 4 n=1 Tax=Cephus cinctus TaxID=211228 RepID=A0AAJ7C1P3_CEPCN|nr:SET and MYND domain-containing protein 4 [Cephus cinctus]
MLDNDVDVEDGEFFRANLLEVRRAVGLQDFKKFSALTNNGERVAFLLGYPEARALPIEVEKVGSKDAEKTLKLKDVGNKLFGRGEFTKALEIYSNAVLLATRNELGVILANRSAALYHLQRYELALSDVDEAVKIGYPVELVYKLEERRARCLLALKRHSNAVKAFRSALKSLDNAKIPLQKKQKVESDIRMMLAVMDKGRQLNAGLENLSINETNEDKKLPKIPDRNPVYPACSNSVEIRDAGGAVGRHAVASKDILPGDILVVEKPHSAVLLSEYRLSHCQLCFSRIVAPIPAACYACSCIAYCSPRCRDADAEAHLIECNILTTLWQSNASVTCLLALKAVTQRPFADLLKLQEHLKVNAGKSNEITKSHPYRGDHYEAFHGLVTHEDERTADDLFHRAHMAAWLLRVLKRTSYLPKDVITPDDAQHKLSEIEIFIGGLLLHNIQLLQFNAHEISELQRPKFERTLANAKSIFIGGGVYPTVALFNHSCNPGVIRYFVGTTMIIRAVRTIMSGEEICENYGPIFTTTPEKERKRKLRLQYWFDCACEACTEQWPLLNEIDPRILRFKCDTGRVCGNILPVRTDSNEFMINCSKCTKSTNILKGLKALQDTDALFKIASRNLEEGKHDQALKAYLEILKLLDENLALPIRDYHLCQQGVRLCLLTMGNTATV